MKREMIDLRTDEQQRDEHLYYPGFCTCGNCAMTYPVLVACGVPLEIAAQGMRCPRCWMVGTDLPDGHLALPNPGPLPEQMPMPDEEDAEPYMPGDDLLT